MKKRYPVWHQRYVVDGLGRTCRVEVLIEQTSDFIKYPPEGKKCTFRLLRETGFLDDEFELVMLIDNHAPYGFHYHDKLPHHHDSRVKLMVFSWREAWIIFDQKVKELLK